MTIKFVQAITLVTPLDLASGGTGSNLSSSGPGFLTMSGVGANVNVRAIAIADLPPLLPTTISGFTNGSVLFASGTVIGQDPAQFFWDNTNKRLGIGNAAPSEKLHVTGNGRFTTGIQLDWLSNNVVPYVNSVTKLLNGSTSFVYDSANISLSVGGTSTIAGNPRFVIKGVDTDATTGPHFQTNTAADIYPLVQILSYTHDSIHITFDGYFDGAWKSSDAGSTYRIAKNADTFGIYYAGGVSPGSTISTWLNPLSVNAAGSLIETVSTAITNSVGTTVLIKHNSSGTPAAGFGSQFFTQLDSSTTINQNASSIATSWSEATHATRKARIRFVVYDTAARTALDIDTNGAQPFLTLYGATSVEAQDTATGTSIETLALSRKTSGTPGVGLGGSINMKLDSTTTEDVAAADISWSWVTATHASRKARLAFTLYDTSPRSVMVFDTNGSAPLVGFLGASAVLRQTSGADLTNSVTAGGVNDTITNWTNLTTYSTDAAAIRNAIYQLARKLKQINDGLRNYGLFD